jgi:porin
LDERRRITMGNVMSLPIIMKKKFPRIALASIFLLFGCLNHPAVFGYDITDKFSIGGVLAGAYQFQSVDADVGEVENGNAGRGSLPFQPEFSFRPTDKDEIFAKFGYVAGNGLNEISPFVLAPWATDLEDDVKDINGRNRDHLLTSWYKHTFQFGEDHTLGLTGGLIDSTDYLDENAYSNDEYTQFMNEALVNGPLAFLPSYDIGGAIEWEVSKIGVKGVVMNAGENYDGNNFLFYGIQFGYTLNTSLGVGNYRILGAGATEDFLDPQGINKESRLAFSLSLDQEFGDIIGGWVRIMRQDDDAAVIFDSLYSGGINISGKLWGRGDDNIGMGYGYLNGGNLGIDNTRVAELYARFALNDYFAITPDIQYMMDKYTNGNKIDGFIYGLRVVVEF